MNVASIEIGCPTLQALEALRQALRSAGRCTVLQRPGSFDFSVIFHGPAPADEPELGVQEPPKHPWIYNQRQADGTFPKLSGFFDREPQRPATTDITPADYAAAEAMGEVFNPVDAEIEQLMAEYRQTADEMERLEDVQRAAKDRLRILLIQRGENWKDADGYARLVSDSSRTTYETKALDELIIADPVKNGWLKEYRKEFAVRGGVQVK